MAGSKVWVVQANTKSPSFHKAVCFGTLHYMIEGFIDMNPHKMSSAQLCAIVKRKVRVCLEKEDYILLSGNKLLNALVLHYGIEKFGRVRVLVYDGSKNEYFEQLVGDAPDCLQP